MAKRIIIVVVAILLVWLLWWWYSRWKAGNALASGDVVVTEPADRPRTDRKEPAATTTYSQESTKPIVYPAAQSTVTAPAAMPATDSISPNPPNGMVFAGTGHFQVYRQGNLTWRINTDSGQACVLFATDEEWRKPKVYRRGCGNS